MCHQTEGHHHGTVRREGHTQARQTSRWPWLHNHCHHQLGISNITVAVVTRTELGCVQPGLLEQSHLECMLPVPFCPLLAAVCGPRWVCGV